MNLYIGIPIIWRVGRKKYDRTNLWFIKRPDNGFFIKKYLLVSLLGRFKLYENGFFSLVTGLSRERPGFFFIRVPSFLYTPKKFGYKLIDEDFTNIENWVEHASKRLDLNSIDVP